MVTETTETERLTLYQNAATALAHALPETASDARVVLVSGTTGRALQLGDVFSLGANVRLFYDELPGPNGSEGGVWEMSQVAPLMSLGPLLESSIHRVQQLKAMPPNWDGYGSPPIQPSAVSVTIQLMRAIARISSLPPHIVPVSGGGLQLEWAIGQRELEIGVAPSGSLDYLTDENDDMQGDTFSLADTSRLVSMFDWLQCGGVVSRRSVARDYAPMA